MRLQALTDEALAAAIGARIQTLRLKKNISQEEVAKEAGISRQTLLNLINGKGTLLNLLAVLRVIGELESVSSLLAEIRPSPLQIIKMLGVKRVRATGKRATRIAKEEPATHAGLPKASKTKDKDW